MHITPASLLRVSSSYRFIGISTTGSLAPQSQVQQPTTSTPRRSLSLHWQGSLSIKPCLSFCFPQFASYPSLSRYLPCVILVSCLYSTFFQCTSFYLSTFVTQLPHFFFLLICPIGYFTELCVPAGSGTPLRITRPKYNTSTEFRRLNMSPV